jgi:hypothetical protein
MLKDIISVYFICKIVFYLLYALSNLNIILSYIFLSYLSFNIILTLKDIIQDGDFDIKKIIIFSFGIMLSFLF